MAATIIALWNWPEVIVAIFCFLLLYFFRSKEHPWNWPFIGMLPVCFPIFSNIFDSITDVLKCNGGTFLLKGQWFCNRDMLFTSNPENVYHILSSNFSNYPKGPDTKLLFEPYGRFLFTLDFDEWRSHRKINHEFFNSQRMQRMTPQVNLEILEKGLIPVLDHACEQGLVLDLQDILLRFMLDATMIIATGDIHGSLSIGLQEDKVLKAMHDVNKGILRRHILPEIFWKLQRWLGVEQEKKLSEGWKLIEDFVTTHIKKKQEDKNDSKDSDHEEFYAVDFFSVPSELMVDVIKGFLFAATDTTSSALTWFFKLVLENPAVENRIREEIEENLSTDKYEKHMIFYPVELHKLTYLHAALQESMRLYPPVPLQMRTCLKPDTLPSGRHVKSGLKVVISPYAMGRMKSIWGEDCHQFKPERWISDKGQ